LCWTTWLDAVLLATSAELLGPAAGGGKRASDDNGMVAHKRNHLAITISPQRGLDIEEQKGRQTNLQEHAPSHFDYGPTFVH